MKPKVLVFSGYGLNSEDETAFGFEMAGAAPEIVHINEIIGNTKKLLDYQILAFPGGFSYGDDTGAGRAYANKARNHLWDWIYKIINADKLIIGICNGCQIITGLGLVPATNLKYGEQQAAVVYNDSARLITRWTDMEVVNSSPWLKGLKRISLPIAHGEGKFFAEGEILKALEEKKQIALKYIKGDTSTYLDLPANPNGSLLNIAGMTDESGRILGIMPHPERGMFFVQRPDWQLRKEALKRLDLDLPEYSDGLQIFKNAVDYFG